MKYKIFIIIFGVAFLSIINANIVWAGSATVSWNANAESDLAGYKIYYGTSPRTGLTLKTVVYADIQVVLMSAMSELILLVV